MSNIPGGDFDIWDDWRKAMSDKIWQQIGRSASNRTTSSDLFQPIQQLVDMMIWPGIFSYFVTDTSLYYPVFVGGSIQHIYGVEPHELLACSVQDLAGQFVVPAQQACTVSLLSQSTLLMQQRGNGRICKRSMYYQHQTHDGRVFQAVQQGQAINWNHQGVPTTWLEVVADISHLRTVNALPLLTLLDTTNPEKSELITITTDGEYHIAGAWAN